ncbi:MAG: 4-hydroxyphenylpyruvate dioxygenase [Bacteroidia bacterium]|nr:4-hydroxyphenylpyruvate dioxygenase [Bacteroidia bacterium]MDW8015366.1 4-hydroxyphenylpyruvate dioxygenase [Bacteroidia bacterium]
MSQIAEVTLKRAEDSDFLPILGTDYIEFYVGNARQAAYYYQHAFGFQPIAYRGLESGYREAASYVLRQGKITFVFTTPYHPGNFIADHIYRHGDGVRVLALQVEDATQAYAETTRRGGRPFMPPTRLEDENGYVILSGIHTYGDTVHIFVERGHYNGPFLPGYLPWGGFGQSTPIGLKYVDHCVGNVYLGEMNQFVAFYRDVMGFRQLISFDDKDISTEYSALMSKVMANGNGYIKFPINEPAQGRRKSQIEEYLEYYHGQGVQHIAMATDDIIHTVRELRRRGIEFLETPKTYYETLLDRVGQIDEPVEVLAELGILVDRDDEGYLLQIFTKPVQDRPTLFYEIIQRKGAKSFGKGNFKALFEAIEREQARRGNL